MPQNLWILTEERPKASVIKNIFEILFRKKSYDGLFNEIRII